MTNKHPDEIEAVLARFNDWGSVGADIFITKDEVGYCKDVNEVKHVINEKILDAIETIYSELGIK